MAEPRQQILVMGQTSGGSVYPVRGVLHGSTVDLEIENVIGTVHLGTVDVGAISGSVHVEGTPTPDIVGGTVDVVKHVESGSIDSSIVGQPIGISGTVETSGISDISGTVEVSAMPSISGTVDVRTGSVGISGQPVDIAGTVDLDKTSTGTYGAVDVTSTATTIASPKSGRKSILVQNTGTPNVYVGFDSSVTSSTGIALNGASTAGDGGGNYSADDYTGSVVGITTAGTASVRFAEVG